MTIITKNSDVQNQIPQTNELIKGELALNTRDGKLFALVGQTGQETVQLVGGSGGELILVQENNNQGWCLNQDNRDNKGPIGFESIDLSNSGIQSSTLGSTGNNSFSEGYETQASGEFSHAEGHGTIASGTGSHAEGMYNIGLQDTIHETGIGSSGSRKNGLEIYKDGRVRAPELTDHLINTNRSLITKEYADLNYVGPQNIDDLDDVDTSTNAPVQDDCLRFDGTNWVNKAPEGISIDDLSDVNTANVTTGQIIQWDGINWVSGNQSSSSELEKITESGNTGWALLGDDRSKKADIGKSAVDFTITKGNVTNKGASGESSFSEGYNTIASGKNSHAEGAYTTASGRLVSHAEGWGTTASGCGSHAEGHATTASGPNSHTEGYKSIASGDHSHAEGGYTTASGHGSHAEGYQTEASGDHSHAEGYETEATGDYGSHAEGGHTTASGYGSHAEGYRTKAINQASHAAGKYNVGTSTDTIHETGIGADDANRANAFEIYTDGRVRVPELTNALVDNDRSVITKEYADANYAGGGASELEKITEGGHTGWRLLGADPDKHGNIGDHAVDFSYSNTTSTSNGATGEWSHAEGFQTKASGNYSSHAEGYQTGATGTYGSHAEGSQTIASGAYGSHAEGHNTEASGDYGSHAEGHNTAASGYASHAEGRYTKAINDYSHAAGKYNTGTATDTIHETGIGADSSNRANAFEIYTDGTLTAPECTNDLIDSRGDKTLVTKEYVDTNGGGGELKSIGGNDGPGWGLQCRIDNDENFGPIGHGAVDFSASDRDDVYGATGKFSFATGYHVKASGGSSVAIGRDNQADGHYSQAFGQHSVAQNAEMFVSGRHNVGTSNDTIHETGIGTSNTNKKNAFEIYTDGRVRVPELTNALVDNDRSVITREYADANYGGAVSMDELTDADTTTTAPVQDDYLKFDGTNWVPASPDTISIDEISDVDTTTSAPTNGQVLKWDGINWVPDDEAGGGGSTFDGLDDTNITGKADMDYIKWDAASSKWINAQPGTMSIDEISDVDTTTSAPTNGQVLKWDGTNWVPGDNKKTVLGETDFDGATGDDTFVITGKVIKELYVYNEGLKIRSNAFTFSDDGTDTTVTLNSALTSNAWISVEYLKDI